MVTENKFVRLFVTS